VVYNKPKAVVNPGHNLKGPKEEEEEEEEKEEEEETTESQRNISLSQRKHGE
jgi:hypothetical protein